MLAASRGGQRLPKEGSIVSREVDMESGMANEELQAIFLDEEVRKLRNALSIERTKSNRLMRIIEKKVLDRQKSSRLVQMSWTIIKWLWLLYSTVLWLNYNDYEVNFYFQL